MTPVQQNVFVYKGGTQKVPKNIVKASIDPNVRIIPSMAFKGCKLLTHLSFHPQGELREIKSFAFSDCLSLEEIELPKTTMIVGCGAFANCIAARRVWLNEGLIELHTSSFKGCSMVQHLCLPSTLELLGKWAFAGCQQLKEVAIHHGRLVKIDDSAFEHCDNLQVIGIPSSITVIGRRAIPETTIEERENAGIVWQQVYNTILEMDGQCNQAVSRSATISPTNVDANCNSIITTAASDNYDLTVAKKDIQGLNTDILEILDTNQKLQAQAAMLVEGQVALTSELNVMKRQNAETREELLQTVQERDALQQEVAAMNKCLHVLKDGVKLLATNTEQQQQEEMNTSSSESPSSASSSLPQMIDEFSVDSGSKKNSKKRSRSELDNNNTSGEVEEEESSMGVRIKRILTGILWSSSS